MDILGKLGLLLLLFGVIVFGSKLLLSRKTQNELDALDDLGSSFYQTHTRWMTRLILIAILTVILLYIVFVLE
tara:strand:- start:3546 stop:3764 length:219 start_codon:yes stop_codon:yes gene_type:complete